MITSGAQSGSVSEIADNAAGENVTVHHQSGTVTFTDVDLSDGETGSVTARQVTPHAGERLYADAANTMRWSMRSPSIWPRFSGMAPDVVWHYNISDSALDFLGDNDQLALTFSVQVDDHMAACRQKV